MGKVGRKGVYENWIKGEGLKKIVKWVSEGLTDKQIAEEKIGVKPQTFYDWLNRFSEFSDTYKKAKVKTENAVENALFKCAIGETYQEEFTEITNADGEVIRTIRKKRKVAANPMAAMCWLKHKNPEKWGDW